MNFNDALTRNALLGELGAAKGLKSKAMTEKIMLGIHYRKAVEEWMKAREAIDGEKEASEEVKAEAANKKAMEDCGLSERRMSAEAFEQVVEAMMPLGSIHSFMAGQPKDGEKQPEVPVEMWLYTFADMLVENK